MIAGRVVAFAAMAFCAQARAMVIDPVDPAFGVAVVPANGSLVEPAAMAIAQDQRVAIVYLEHTLRADSSDCRAPGIVMIDAAGHIDTTFGVGGRASAALLGIPPCVQADTLGIGFAADGTIFVTATPDALAAPTTQTQRVWKIKPGGAGDAGFGGALPVKVGYMLRPTVQVLADGSIAVGGTALSPNATQQRTPMLALARLQANGAMDETYGAQGVAFAVPANRPIHGAAGGGMYLAADGTGYVAGNIFEDDAGARLYTDATIARFDPRGILDTSYGDAGFAIPLRDASTYAQSLAVVNGEAYLAGVQSRDVPYAFLVRVKASGQLDLAFGTAGVTGTDRFTPGNFEPRVVVDRLRRSYFVTSDPHGHVRIARYTSDGNVDPAFGLGGSAYIAASDYRFGNGTMLAISASDGVYVGAGPMFSSDDLDKTALGVARVSASGGHRDGVVGATAIIYYNKALDHYFLTASTTEQALLDSGSTVGWVRTGQDFRVVTSSGASTELSPVCRYYGRPEAHLDSHFFSAARDECDAVAQRFAASWLLETSEAFAVHEADRTTGACPRGSEKIVRAFNARSDANHYYGVTQSAPQGWVYEGYGPGPVPTAFCAPLL